MLDRRNILGATAATAALSLGGCVGPFAIETSQETQDLSKLSLQNSALGDRILAQLVSGAAAQTGALICPVGLGATLAMLNLGSKSPSVLSGAFGVQRPASGFGALQAQMASGAEVEFSSSQSAWFSDSIQPKRAFVEAARRDLKAVAARADFSTGAGIAPINAWVNTATKGKISSVLDEPDPSLAFLLASAAYFKGSWLEPFDPSMTASSKFSLSNGTQVRVPYMIGSRAVRAFYDDGIESIALPFKGDQFEIVLTKGQTNEQTLAILQRGIVTLKPDKYAEERLDLFIPKMKLSFSGDLKETVSGFGFEAILGPSAQLSNLSVPPATVGLLLHKTVMEVDEAGAVAASVTAAGGYRSFAPAKPFLLDKPFLIHLRHKPTGGVVMAGFVSDPGVR